MTLTYLYQMYDTLAQSVAGPIIIEKRDAPAIRAFHSVLAQGHKTLPGQYPSNFELRMIGSQDEDTAQLTALTPATIATGSAWVEQLAKQQETP